MVTVEDADWVFRQAIEAGRTEIKPMEDTFWGDRYGRVRDPFGHQWSVGTRKEDLSPEEIQRRGAEFFASITKGDRS